MKALLKPSTGEYTEKKSKFIAYIAPVSSEQEALDIIDAKKKQYHDARHNCSAYILTDAAGNTVSRFSDDGEPSGTAGRPILDVLEGSDIIGIVCVVTRYFGGILLGTGGLVRAYSAAAKAALENADTTLVLSGWEASLTCSYNDLGKVEYILRENDVPILDTVYENDVKMSLVIPDDCKSSVEKQISNATSAKAMLEFGEATNYAKGS